jgi:phenylacetate-CoA ligase
MVINVEIRSDWFTDNYASLDNLRKKMARDIRDEVLVTPLIKLVEAGTLPESGGKAVRVIDNRESSGKGCGQ